jgi:hypothetical protein
MVVAGENNLRGSCESTESDHSIPGLLSKGKKLLTHFTLWKLIAIFPEADLLIFSVSEPLTAWSYLCV